MNRPTSKRYPNLKAWREAANLTQRQAAKVLGISQTYYGRLELGTQHAPGKRAKTITQTTGVPLEVIVGAV